LATFIVNIILLKIRIINSLHDELERRTFIFKGLTTKLIRKLLAMKVRYLNLYCYVMIYAEEIQAILNTNN